MILTTRYCLIAACVMHIEGAFSTNSLAFKNNNPGNLRSPGEATGFQKFTTKIDGFNALVKDVAANAGKPLDHFVAKYAPPNENNSVLYLHLLSELTGIAPDEVI